MSSKLVFVSYAHNDRKFLDDELLPFLRHLELGEQIELWNDRLISVGQDWYEQIADKLDQAKVAILLVTQNFLASRFCLHEETPVLLQRARSGKLHLLPLLAEPCNWENERWLARAQMWPGSKSLKEHARPSRKRLLAEFAHTVLAAVNGPLASPPIIPQLDTPHPTHDLHRLPSTGSLLFGRRREIQLLDQAWHDAKTNVVAFTAGGGVGKSTLVRVWAEMLAEDGWRGAERAYAWSFYSQGTGRMTDSETFLNEALAWVGATTDEWQGRSIWDRAELLAERMRRQRTLLILDGVEPLQSGDHGVDRGSLRDPGLRTLIEVLAEGHPGLCVVTTRERLVDLAHMNEPAVVHHNLDRVERLAGRALLRVERVRGEDQELEQAVDNFGGQALALSLAGRFLTDGGTTPHVSGLNALPALEHPVEEGGHPRRVLEAWAQRLGESADLELLSVVGLFDRPADLRAVQAVIDADPLHGLNAHLRKADLGQVVERLRNVRLIASASTHEDNLDTHPLVREHFGSRLKARHPKGWAEGHRRLYQHFKDSTEERPEGLAAMQPLFAAVVHGCAGGLHQEACDEVYYARIMRGDQGYLVYSLGAVAAGLSCLSAFFAERWQRPQSALSSANQAWMLSSAGFMLRGLGRIRESLAPMIAGLERDVAAEDWKNAAAASSNLSEIHIVLGELDQAEARAREALAYAEKSDDLAQSVARRVTLADAIHQLGRHSEARALFAEAERLQVKQCPDFPILNSLGGYHYCELLLDGGEACEVLNRATQTLELSKKRGFLLDVALGHLSLGRAQLATSPPGLDAAGPLLQSAVDGLRAAGATHQLPRGFLARAALYRLRDDLPRARKDLDAVRKLIRRHALRLFEADLALEETRYFLAASDKSSANTTLANARQLITAMNYYRRRSELVALETDLDAKGDSLGTPPTPTPPPPHAGQLRLCLVKRRRLERVLEINRAAYHVPREYLVRPTLVGLTVGPSTPRDELRDLVSWTAPSAQAGAIQRASLIGSFTTTVQPATCGARRRTRAAKTLGPRSRLHRMRPYRCSDDVGPASSFARARFFAASPPMHLRRLRLTNFRSCASTDVRFDKTLTVLAGENNGGKTNVIDALRLVTAPSDERRTRFVRPDDVRVGAADLTLEIGFEELDPAQCGIFFSALSSNAATDASWQFSWSPPAGTARRRSPTWTVGPRRQPEIEPDIRDFIRHVHLPALRDADRDLASSSPGRIEFLLRQLLFGNHNERDDLLNSVRAASDGVLAQPPLVQAQDRVRRAFSPLAAGFHPHDAHLRFVDPTLVGLARDLRFTLTQQGIDPAKLAQTGLGYSNLLYLATVLVELEAAKDAELTLLLVEEPEAHLHPQLQRSVLDLLEHRAEESARPSVPGAHAGQIQVIVTTHSPNLTAATFVRRIVVLRSCSPTVATASAAVESESVGSAENVAALTAAARSDAQPPKTPDDAEAEMGSPPTPSAPAAPGSNALSPAPLSETVAIAIAALGLNEVAQRKIDRYLDVTKASLLFGQRVLLVEGIAEALLMPAFASCVLTTEERERFRSAAVIAIDGVDFEPYIRLLLGCSGSSTARLADAVVVLTDEDPVEPDDAALVVKPDTVMMTTIGAEPVAADSVAPAVVPTKPPAGESRASELRALAATLEAGDRLHIEITPLTLEASLISDPITGQSALDVLKEAFVECAGPRGRAARTSEWQTRIASLPPSERGRALVEWMTTTKTRKGDFAQVLVALIERDQREGRTFAVPPHIAKALRALVASS